MPPNHVWSRLLARWKKNDAESDYVTFKPEIAEINYGENPISGVSEVEKLLEASRAGLANVRHRTLIIAADRDRLVDARGAAKIFGKIGSRDKELVTVSSLNHNIIYGHQGRRVREMIASFVKHCKRDDKVSPG